MCRSIRDEVDLNASPKEVYRAYLDSKTHAAFTGASARMSRVIGGRFTAGDGYISGFNLHLEPGKQIVQAWRGSDWPEGVYSFVSLELRSRGKGTHLTFEQRGIPDAAPSGVSKAEWRTYYWDPWKEYYAPLPAKK
jgi:activator of HSP90 ATPase